jgi:WD40 repeat protein
MYPYLMAVLFWKSGRNVLSLLLEAVITPFESGIFLVRMTKNIDALEQMSLKAIPLMSVNWYCQRILHLTYIQEDVEENPYHKLLLSGHDHAVRALAARGRTLVSGSYDCSVRVWDVISGEVKWVLYGHTQKGRSYSC